MLTAKQKLGSILLTGRDPKFLEGTAGLLDSAGYDCFTTTGARRNESRSEIHLVIADVEAADCAACGPICDPTGQDGESPPLVLITGRPSVETATRAVQVRAVGYFTKPVDDERLLELVRREIDAEQCRRLIHKRRVHIETLLADIRHLESATADSRRVLTEDMLNTYLALLMEHMFTAMGDLRCLVEAVALREGDECIRKRLEGARPFLLLEALREVITVLERTKKSFKSKELADLRLKLETLLANANPSGCAPARVGEDNA